MCVQEETFTLMMVHSKKNPAFHARHLPNVSRSAGAEGFTLVAECARLGCRAFHAEQILSLKRSAAEGLSRRTPSVRVRLRHSAFSPGGDSAFYRPLYS